ncbi:hypothetical protein [Citrobacter portucalensis]|uniref:hypothetical protein n=1 Tax=Citrobacter portucalensis TaxID=1639133 RepID=UPI00404121C9
MAKVLMDSIDDKNIYVQTVENFLGKERVTSENRYVSKLFSQRLYPALLIFIGFLLSKWNKNREKIKYDSVLYFAIDDFYTLAKLIKKNKDIKNHILWLWNPCTSLGCNSIDVKIKLFFIKLFGVKIYTFDMDDANKYNLNYHNQVYAVGKFKNNQREFNKNNGDVLFVGANKGRLDILLKLEKIFTSIGLIPRFYVLTDNERKENNNIHYLSQNMDYTTYIDYIKASEFVLDIVQDGQSGLTLRALEAAFFRKKLITTNKNIKNSNLYNENNVYLIDIDDPYIKSNLTYFCQKKYIPYDKDVLADYDVLTFLNKIQKNTSV